MCLHAIHVSSFMKGQIQTFVHFFTEFFLIVQLWEFFIYSRYNCFINCKFLSSLWLLCSLSWESFKEWPFIVLMQSNFLIFSLKKHNFCARSRKLRVIISLSSFPWYYWVLGYTFRFMIFWKKFFVYLFLAAPSLYCFAQTFSRCGEQGLLFITVPGRLIAVAPPAAKHRLWTCKLQWLQAQ